MQSNDNSLVFVSHFDLLFLFFQVLHHLQHIQLARRPIENLEVEVDTAARIVIDESSGIVVMGENVKVSTVAIAQGNLTISIQEDPFVSQPAPLSRGETVVVPSTGVNVEEEEGGLVMVPGGVPLRQLVNGLNALGVTPRDMISILQALKAAGAIQAEIEVM